MKAIVAVDENWGIGKDGKLLFKIPLDMKFFKNMTTNKVVVMGRKTFEDSIGGNALKNRINVVITNQKDYNSDVSREIITIHNKIELKDAIDLYGTDNIMIIGGESIYKELLPYCDTVYVTKVYDIFESDRYFPNLDELKEWKISNSSEMFFDNTKTGLHYQFVTYINPQNQLL